MTYWPWWAGGLALCFVMVFHWLSMGRMMAVSGRFSGLVNRLREGPKKSAPQMSQAELLAALQGATVEEFGATALPSQPPAPEVSRSLSQVKVLPPQPAWLHWVFFAALIAGGALSSVLAHTFHVVPNLDSEGFRRFFGDNPVVAAAVLFVGGTLVGFGTRMSGGCTSGHGLCGVSRIQPGSLAATAAFFAAGIVTAFALELL